MKACRYFPSFVIYAESLIQYLLTLGPSQHSYVFSLGLFELANYRFCTCMRYLLSK